MVVRVLKKVSLVKSHSMDFFCAKSGKGVLEMDASIFKMTPREWNEKKWVTGLS